MPSTIPLLFALQEVDLALDARRAALESARERMQESEELLAARAALSEAEDEVQALSGRGREFEFAVEDIREKVGPLEQRLYSGSIKNPKELQELDHQVSTFKGMLQEREAALLEYMNSVEQATARRDGAREELARVQAGWEDDQRQLTAEADRLDAEIAELDRRRAEAASRIDAGSLRVYDHLRPRTGGRAVARVERGGCSGCRISLPTNVVSRARSGAGIVQCTSCQRILLAG